MVAGNIWNEGNDALFGDLGHDWLVGGTGRDNLYGGYGNDLLNADDDLGTAGGLNNLPDTDATYDDRAIGGAGLDVLIANTGGDRLIDWTGEFNTYLVPFNPNGNPTISRGLQPQLAEYLYALSAGDGADPTRAADTGHDPARNGEPDGELGLVRQQDFDWADQTGSPADPQSLQLGVGPRDIVRAANFNDGQLQGFAVDSGSWQVAQGALEVTAQSRNLDSVSVLQLADPLPIYFELQASISVIKPTAGWKANAYLIFDYQGPDDFKFAGIDISINKLVMGHRDAAGWTVDAQVPFQAKDGTYYNIQLAVNGSTASLLVNNTTLFSHTYAVRMVDGVPLGLNWGYVGVGSDNSRGTFDNLVVQTVPPTITTDYIEDFSDGIADFFTGTQAGSWNVAGGRYVHTTAVAGTAVSLLDFGRCAGPQSQFVPRSAGGIECDTGWWNCVRRLRGRRLQVRCPGRGRSESSGGTRFAAEWMERRRLGQPDAGSRDRSVGQTCDQRNVDKCYAQRRTGSEPRIQ